MGQPMRPFMGRLSGAPLWGYRLCAPLWGVFPVPLYGATVDHVGVCPTYSHGYRGWHAAGFPGFVNRLGVPDTQN